MTTQRIGRLEVTVDRLRGDGGARATLAGRIDETSATALAQLATQLPAGDTTLDTDGVTFVNSIGMREWIRLIRLLRGRGRVTLVRVADVLITQMNLIPELATSATVVSFHAQYACGACGAEAAPVIDAVAHAAELRRMQAPPMPCPECSGKMELADFPERYLTMFKV